MESGPRFPYTYCYDFMRQFVDGFIGLSRAECAKRMREAAPDEADRLAAIQAIARMHIDYMASVTEAADQADSDAAYIRTTLLAGTQTDSLSALESSAPSEGTK